MEIFINNGRNQDTLEVTKNMTIAELKKKYADLKGESKSFQFRYCGEVLKDNKTLSEYGIEDGNQIMAINNSMGGGGGMEIAIKNGRKLNRLIVSESMTIAELKKKYKEINGDSGVCTFLFGAKVLNDENRTLEDYGIKNNSVICGTSSSFIAGGGGFL